MEMYRKTINVAAVIGLLTAGFLLSGGSLGLITLSIIHGLAIYAILMNREKK